MNPENLSHQMHGHLQDALEHFRGRGVEFSRNGGLRIAGRELPQTHSSLFKDADTNSPAELMGHIPSETSYGTHYDIYDNDLRLTHYGDDPSQTGYHVSEHKLDDPDLWQNVDPIINRKTRAVQGPVERLPKINMYVFGDRSITNHPLSAGRAKYNPRTGQLEDVYAEKEEDWA